MQLSFGNEPVLYLAGYRGRDLDAFVRLVQRHGIVQVLDIREHATSRRPGFGKTSLTEALRAAPATYVHLPQADNPFRHDEDRASALSRYAAHLDAHPEIEAHVAAIVHGKTSLLLTFEREASLSHRSVLGARIAKREKLRVVEL